MDRNCVSQCGRTWSGAPAASLRARARSGPGLSRAARTQWPAAALRLGGKVKRLFEDYEQVERNYFKETGIFPIMHTVAIRRDVYEANRWVARSLMMALEQSQRRTYEDLYETAALKTMLPWLTSHVEQVRREMGEDFWPYGYEKNVATLQTFLRYHHEQGLSKRLLKPEELFAPEAMEAFKI